MRKNDKMYERVGDVAPSFGMTPEAFRARLRRGLETSRGKRNRVTIEIGGSVLEAFKWGRTWFIARPAAEREA